MTANEGQQSGGVTLLCDVEVDGVQRRAFFSSISSELLEHGERETVRQYVQANLRSALASPTLTLVAMQPMRKDQG